MLKKDTVKGNIMKEIKSFDNDIRALEKRLFGYEIKLPERMTFQQRNAYVMSFCKVDFPEDWCSLIRDSRINLICDMQS